MKSFVQVEVFKSHSVKQTLELGRRLAGRLGRGDCIALVGELGAGKTVFVRGLSEGLGIEDKRLVSSPTFVLVQEYPAKMPIYHIDLYRLADPEAELPDLGIGEMLSQGVVLIEWADRAGDSLPRPRWEIRVEIYGARSRRFVVSRIEP